MVQYVRTAPTDGQSVCRAKVSDRAAYDVHVHYLKK